jgi:hypothetical protein
VLDTAGALHQLADALVAGGVPAFTDPRDEDLPGVWVQRVQVAYDILGDSATLRVRLLMIAPDVGADDAMGELDRLEDACVDLLPPNIPGQVVTERGDVLLPDDPTLYPGRFYDIDAQITPDTPAT